MRAERSDATRRSSRAPRLPVAASCGAALGASLLLVHHVAFAVLWFGPPWFGRGRWADPVRLSWPWGLVHLLVALTGGWLWWGASRLPRGMRGRGRLRAMALASLGVALIGGGTGAGVLWVVAEALQQGFVPVLAHAEVFLAAPAGFAEVAAAGAVAAGLLDVVLLVLGVGLWFLVPVRRRRKLWVSFDLPLTLLVLGSPWWLPLTGLPEEGLKGLRLSLWSLFSVRAFARVLPLALSAAERMGFRTMVAARHLRARKSGFLATISVLSILAVALSNSSLVTTLSVMGGFRNDLKRKILDHNAHVRVESEDGGPFEGWEPLIDRIERVEGVVAVQPIVQGEVMATSATNLAGALLVGIDPERVARATRLAQQIERGGLQFLAHPERLEVRRLDSSPSETGLGALDVLDEVLERDAGKKLEADPKRHGKEGEARARPRPEALDPPAALRKGARGAKDDDDGESSRLQRLPGVVVGRELARALRLFVGDEVQVVTPFGELGPSGPMPRTRSFRVVGIFYSGMYEYDMKHLYVLLPEAQRMLGLGDAVSAIEARVDDVSDAPRIAARVSAALGRSGLRVKDWQQLNRNLFGALALEKLAMFVTLGIAVLVAGFCIFGTLTLMVQEKRREVAVLRAMGASGSDIERLFLIEGLLIGAIGTCAGLGLGYLLCYMAERFGVHMNPEVYYIDRLPVHVDPAEFAAVGTASLLVSVLATWVPASLAAKLRPVEALRHE